MNRIWIVIALLALAITFGCGSSNDDYADRRAAEMAKRQAAYAGSINDCRELQLYEMYKNTVIVDGIGIETCSSGEGSEPAGKGWTRDYEYTCYVHGADLGHGVTLVTGLESTYESHVSRNIDGYDEPSTWDYNPMLVIYLEDDNAPTGYWEIRRDAPEWDMFIDRLHSGPTT